MHPDTERHLYERALICHSILVEMVDNREACSGGHRLFKAMRDLQRVYSGVFPRDLRELWEDVKIPIHPDAVVQYHPGVDRLKGWFENQFQIKETFNNPNSGKSLNRRNASDWISDMEKELESKEEPEVEISNPNDSVVED